MCSENLNSFISHLGIVGATIATAASGKAGASLGVRFFPSRFFTTVFSFVVAILNLAYSWF